MQDRRETLRQSLAVAGLLAAAGVWPGAARAFTKQAFDAATPAEVVKAYGGRLPVESRDVKLEAPEISENGAFVPITLSCSAPGVKSLLVLAEKNPTLLVAKFDLGEAIEASFSLRIKVAQSSDLYAVALLADGRALHAKREVKVTLGGCGA